MFKKTLLVGAVALAAAGVASADGFYVGAGLGGSGFHDKNTVTSADGSTGSNDSGNLGVIGGLLGGYTFNFPNQFNLGLEAFVNASSDKISYSSSDSDSNMSGNLKARYQYGLRVLPGYQVTPDTDFHAIVGYVRGNFKATGSGNDAVEGSYTYSQTTNLNGFQVGVGSGTNVAKNVGVRADVIYTGYANKTTNSTVGSITNKINTLDGIVSVAYKFG